MKKFLLKFLLYTFLIFLALEIIVRIFHLYFQYPKSTINDLNVELYIPEQKGYFVTGNRGMNIVQYRINQSGFNSFREYNASYDSIEIALVGDSFIEGFHQDFFNSIGAKIEKRLNKEGVSVFEYGYSGYDLADQLNLISKYKEDFEKIDLVIIYLKFAEDLDRNLYEPNYFRANLENLPSFKVKNRIKLFSYLEGIGITDPVRNLFYRIKSGSLSETAKGSNDQMTEMSIPERLGNFETLMDSYPEIDRQKLVFLIDMSITPHSFITYCDSQNYAYLDFGEPLSASKGRTLLIYDQHWNDHGREIISEVISNYIVNETNVLK